MANCVAADVRLIIDTGLTDADLGSLITLADAEMTARGLTTSTWTTSLKKLVSMMLTASLVVLRDAESKSVGDYSEKILTAKDWRALAEDRINKAGDPALLSWNDPLPIGR